MENLTEIENNKSELTGQNIPQNQPESDFTSKLFSIENLNKEFTSKNKLPLKRYKSERIKQFLSKEEKDDKKKLSTIKEIVIDDQNEKAVSNNPKKRFMLNEEKKFKKNKDNKKINLIEELRNFDRKMQMNMENYINKIKQKKFEILYNKNLKNNYEKLNLDNSFNQKDNDINANNGINNIPAEKDMNDNKLDDYEKLKQRYFCHNIFSARFPNSEYKVKYLNNYLQKDSLIKNLFNQNKMPIPIPNPQPRPHSQLEINTTTNNNINDINTSPTNAHFNSSINNSNPFKPSMKLNMSCNNIYMNNRYSNCLNEQNSNNNRYSTKSNKNININNVIENKYNEVFNSINERLNKSKYKKKYGNIDNIKFRKAPSSERIKTKFNAHNRIKNGFNFFKVTNNFFNRNSIF